MKRRQLLQLGAGAAISAACPAPVRRPNILFLFTDDQRADTIGALGNPHIRTPNLDGIVRSGFTFSNAYCMGSNVPAVCLPSRNMLLSGRCYFRWEGRYAPGDQANLADSLRQAGYETYHHGKRGNSAREIHKRFEHSKYVEDKQARTSGEPGKEIVDEAIGFLRARRRERPFFLYLAFACPHDPRVAARRYLDQYEADKMPLPANYMPVHPFDNGEMTIRDELLAPWPRTEAEIRRHLRDYYAVITGLDDHIGRLLNYLRESGEYEDTIIVFSSDQGIAIGSHGLMGKQNLYDHSMKAPLIFSGPGIPPGRSDALVYLFDVYPTLVDLAGGAIPPGLDGMSLAPIIRGESVKSRPSLFLAYRDVQRAIRDERYKLILYPQVSVKQLFDLERDPHELNNLAEEPDYMHRVLAMTEAIRRWQQQLGDTAALESAEPKSPKFVAPRGKELEALLEKWGKGSGG